MTEHRTYWICLGIPPHTEPCGERGVYNQAASGDAGAAAKHTRDTDHATATGLDEAALDRAFTTDVCSWCDANKHDRCRGGECGCACNDREGDQ